MQGFSHEEHEGSTKKMKSLIPIFSLFLLFIFSPLKAEVRAVWVPIWDLKTPGKIDTMMAEISENKINKVMAQIRYRGDAMYSPNRTDSTYSNPDNRCYVLGDSTDFDPLAHLISLGKKYDVEIHGWVTAVIVTPHDLTKLPPEHIYFQHPEWVTANFDGNTMPNDVLEGAYLDPGIPEVRQYITGVISDIVSNYNLDGIHLDYIRYPNEMYGYNALARSIYEKDIEFKDADSWPVWKQAQISKLVRRIYKEIKVISPDVQITAAVISDRDGAAKRYGQNWADWLDKGFIDSVYLMAYTTKDDVLQKKLNKITKHREKVVVGLRAWTENSYPVAKINKKIKKVNSMNFAGFGLYSYTGIRRQNYFDGLKY